jgi:predicted dehydrogenase
LVAEKKLGFAIVDLGRFGAGRLLRSLPECKYAKPVALVSGHPDKARDLAQKYGIKPTTRSTSGPTSGGRTRSWPAAGR